MKTTEYLKYLRTTAGMNRHEMAQRLGVSDVIALRWERGIKRIPKDRYDAWVRAASGRIRDMVSGYNYDHSMSLSYNLGAMRDFYRVSMNELHKYSGYGEQFLYKREYGTSDMTTELFEELEYDCREIFRHRLERVRKGERYDDEKAYDQGDDAAVYA